MRLPRHTTQPAGCTSSTARHRSYFVLVKSDYTLRRYKNDADVTADVPSQIPRSYRLTDIEFVAKDTSPRFYLQLRPTAVGGKGEQVKVSAETESERLEWITAIMKLKEQVPKEDEEDDPYRASLWAAGGKRQRALAPRWRRGRQRRHCRGGACSDQRRRGLAAAMLPQQLAARI